MKGENIAKGAQINTRGGRGREGGSYRIQDHSKGEQRHSKGLLHP